MIHETADDEFWPKYYHLPKRVQAAADNKYDLLRRNPDHPSLQFEKKCDVGAGQLWSARVNDRYRALALRTRPGTYTWFWIGEHDEYERKLDLFC